MAEGRASDFDLGLVLLLPATVTAYSARMPQAAVRGAVLSGDREKKRVFEVGVERRAPHHFQIRAMLPWCIVGTRIPQGFHLKKDFRSINAFLIFPVYPSSLVLPSCLKSSYLFPLFWRERVAKDSWWYVNGPRLVSFIPSVQ